MQTPLELRRYRNRKMYSPEEKSYLSLADVQRIVLSGRPLRVVCNVTRRVMTRDVLSYVVMRMTNTPGLVCEADLMNFIATHAQPNAQALAEDLNYA